MTDTNATPSRPALFVLWASLFLSIQYFIGLDNPTWAMAAKGGSVALLGVYAMIKGQSRTHWHIAAVMAIGAVGDVFMEVDTTIGGAFFALGHVVAIALYWMNRRPMPINSQRAAALALLVLTPLVSWQLSGGVPEVALYALFLGAMAAAAWLSRFPRYWTGGGALLFVASDLLIFHRMGTGSDALSQWTVWPLYYAGQALIVIGVTKKAAEG